MTALAPHLLFHKVGINFKHRAHHCIQIALLLLLLLLLLLHRHTRAPLLGWLHWQVWPRLGQRWQLGVQRQRLQLGLLQGVLLGM